MKVLVVGGGIGGLATALSLHAAGIECAVFEQSCSIRELGVGINILPHAVKELARRHRDMRRTGSDKEVTARGVLIAADGIHSTVRRTFHRDEGPLAWNGVMMRRGAVEYAPFLTDRSMLIARHEDQAGHSCAYAAGLCRPDIAADHNARDRCRIR